MIFNGDKKFGCSLLAEPEKRLKAWLLPYVPRRMGMHHLTLMTLLWSGLVIAFSFLARYNIHWLHAASLMIVLQYLTDLMDGEVGRQRNIGLIKWGFYMDHFLDYIFLLSILIGYAFLLPDPFKYLLFFVMAVFGAFMVNSFLSFAATNQFKISYWGIGPTEVRLIFIVVNSLIALFGRLYLLRALPYVLGLAVFGLFVTVYRTQRSLWAGDMRIKRGVKEMPVEPFSAGWRYELLTLRLLKWKIVRNLAVSLLMTAFAVVVVMLRVGFPYHQWVALAIYASSWLPLVVSFKTKKRVVRKEGDPLHHRIRPYLLNVTVALAIMMIGRAAWLLAPPVSTELGHISHGVLEDSLHADLENLLILTRHTRHSLEWAVDSELFGRPLDSLDPAEKRQIRDFWRDVLNILAEMEIIKMRYQGFHQIDYLVQPDLHAKAFGAAFSAFLGQYALTLKTTALVDESPFLNRLLNDEDPQREIPRGSYDAIKQRMTHPDELLRLNAGTAYWALIRKHVDADWGKDIEAMLRLVYHRLGERPSLLIEAPMDLLERTASVAWLPFQRDVASRMSEIRTHGRPYLIEWGLMAEYAPLLQPGDIMLQRRNWYASNVAIPGFWSHVALYVGTPAELDAHFRDQSSISASHALERDYPDAVARLRQPAANGNARRVLEALREGVVFTDLETSAHCDYLAVLRPRVMRDAQYQAIRNALRHVGKPYDFDFDFATDSALVCSELIYKAYHGLPGFDLELQIINGRLIMPPNLIAEKFDQEYSTPHQQMDLVFFLDASERRGMAFPGSENSFRRSWQRPKWDVLLD